MPKKNEKRITLDWFKENCVPETHLHPGCDRCVFGSGNEADNDHDSCQLWASLEDVPNKPGPNIRAAMKRHGIKPDTEQGDSPSFAILTGKRIAPDPDPDDFVAEEVGMVRSKTPVVFLEKGHQYNVDARGTDVAVTIQVPDDPDTYKDKP